jgi:hypothetical protein
MTETRVTDEMRARGHLTAEDGLVLTLLDVIAERDRYRAALDRAVDDLSAMTDRLCRALSGRDG